MSWLESAAVPCVLFCLSTLPAAGQDWSRSVTDYGAVADATTDCTEAFQRAIDDCHLAGGGVVVVPPGHWRIAGHLEVLASVTLEGVWRAPPTVDAYHDPADPEGGPLLRGSVLLAEEGAGDENGHAFLHLGFNSTLRGLTVFYPNQTKTNPPIPYPWTVQSAAADNLSIVDCLFVNPWQAVDFASIVAGRHLVRGLYAQPLRRGLAVDVCYDVGRLEDIHFWPFWTAADHDSPVAQFMLEQGEAFLFARSDWELVTNCFAIAYHVGFRFLDGGQAGPGNYLVTGGGADMCQHAVLVEQTQAHSGVSFANCQIFGDVTVRETNAGPVRFTGCGLFGSIDGARGTALARIAGTGRVSFDNCHFYCIHPGSRAAEAMIVAEEGRLWITDCEFLNSAATAGVNSNPVPIVLEEGVRAAVIVGNEFRGEARIDNRSRGRVEIAHNVERTDEDPFPGEPGDEDDAQRANP